MLITWQWCDEDEIYESTFSEWLKDNEECLPVDFEDIIDEMMRTGQYVIGGGASPTMILKYVGFSTVTERTFF